MKTKKDKYFFSPFLTSKIISFVLALFITVASLKCFSVIIDGLIDNRVDENNECGSETADVGEKEEIKQGGIFSDKNSVSVNTAFSADGLIMCDLNEMRIVAEKSKDNKISIGDLTTIASALLISTYIEEGKLSEDEIIVCPASAARRANYAASSGVYSVGMRLKAKELIRCMIYQSGSSYAYALSVHILGSEENFVVKLNEMGKELGLKNTVFTNVCGEDDGVAVTTPLDVAVIFKYFLDNKMLSEIFSSSEPVKIKKYDTSSSVYLTVYNDFYENVCTESQAKDDGVTGGKGGKCGYSKWAVVTFENMGKKYMVIALGSPSPYSDILRLYAAYGEG